MGDIFKHTDKKIEQNTDRIVNLYNKNCGKNMDPDEDDELNRILKQNIAFPLNYKVVTSPRAGDTS